MCIEIFSFGALYTCGNWRIPIAVHYFVMLIYIFRPKMGEKYKYMDLVGYKYHESTKLHPSGGFFTFYGFHNHGVYALIFIQTWHGKGNSILFGLHGPQHHS